MPDLLVRNINPKDYERLRRRAKARGTSLGQTARELLSAQLKPATDEVWAEIDRIRERIGPVPGDSTKDIREDRDGR
jgi:plasmid stability protein